MYKTLVLPLVKQPEYLGSILITQGITQILNIVKHNKRPVNPGFKFKKPFYNILQVKLQSLFEKAEEKVKQGEIMLQEHQNACRTIIVSIIFGVSFQINKLFLT